VSVSNFYDSLAPWYDVVYGDWPRAVERHADALMSILLEERGMKPQRILDAAVGVGTQALGLAARGCSLTGVDLSFVAVRRAMTEAHGRGVRLPCVVADMRALPLRSDSFDTVISCDNALPHLLDEHQIGIALSEFRRCLRDGGTCLLSMRDYAHPPEDGTVETKDYGARVWQGRPCRLQQVWRWRGHHYDVLFEVFATDSPGERLATTPEATYFAIPVERVLGLMRAAGFRSVHRVDRRFFQPVLVGTR
jgi:ubiquinone/menaquinone biosynthesis C-methylase UbiE